MDFNKLSLDLHRKYHGKISISSKVPLDTQDDLSISYTPGVAEPCRKIAKDKSLAYEYTSRANTVAVVTDGSAVLGLGNIGPEAALPVMEGKAILMKKFAGVDAWPICLNTQDTEEIIATIKNIAPGFGAINLEDISAPRCFEIERRLKEELDIPVFHDDQHGTAIVVLAGLINSLKLVGKNIADVKIIIAGSGAAGIAISRLLTKAGAKNIIVSDSKGAICPLRDKLTDVKADVLEKTNPENICGSLSKIIDGADVFIGVSAPNIIDANDVAKMAEKAIVFAMSNPDPEIDPEEAGKGGVYILATGRSDLPNQLNNVLVFPGVMKGLLKLRSQMTEEMMIAAANALAGMVESPSVKKIIPSPLEEGVSEAVANAIQ